MKFLPRAFYFSLLKTFWFTYYGFEKLGPYFYFWTDCCIENYLVTMLLLSILQSVSPRWLNTPSTHKISEIWAVAVGSQIGKSYNRHSVLRLHFFYHTLSFQNWTEYLEQLLILPFEALKFRRIEIHWPRGQIKQTWKLNSGCCLSSLSVQGIYLGTDIWMDEYNINPSDTHGGACGCIGIKASVSWLIFNKLASPAPRPHVAPCHSAASFPTVWVARTTHHSLAHICHCTFPEAGNYHTSRKQSVLYFCLWYLPQLAKMWPLSALIILRIILC